MYEGSDLSPEKRERIEDLFKKGMEQIDAQIKALEAQFVPTKELEPAAPEEGPSGDLKTCAENLFRRIGATPADIDAAAKEVLREVGYFERKYLQDDATAQKIAGAFRIASRQWETREDRVTIPENNKRLFEDFLNEYAPGMGYEVIWPEPGTGTMDNKHEVSRVQGVRHEGIGGTRRPGFSRNGHAYLRAKVGIF